VFKNAKIEELQFYLLYGCDFLSVTPWEDNTLRVFEIKGLWRLPEPEKKEAVGDWRKLLIEELRDLYFSADVIVLFKSRVMRWRGIYQSCKNEE
jgi:hypothetical protein